MWRLLVVIIDAFVTSGGVVRHDCAPYGWLVMLGELPAMTPVDADAVQ